MTDNQFTQAVAAAGDQTEYTEPERTPLAEDDNSPERVAARRAMFVSFGWTR